MDIVIPRTITNIISENHDTMIGLKGEDSNTEVYFKTCNTSGEITFINGSLYKGALLYGCMHGEGEIIFENGSSYRGTFENNHLHGKGTLVYTNGNEYQGYFKNSLRHGKGLFKCPKFKFEYTGDFHQGKMTGYGIVKYRDASVYEGRMLNGKKHGKGKLTYPHGDYYEGNWVENKKEGFGKTVWSEKEESYQGYWINNQPHGMGTYIWFKKNRNKITLTNRYVGEFEHGLKNGVGTFFYADGSKYEGEFRNNLKHGVGIFTQDDGNIQVSKYVEDRVAEKIQENIDPDFFFHNFSQPHYKSPFEQLELHSKELLSGEASPNINGLDLVNSARKTAELGSTPIPTSNNQERTSQNSPLKEARSTSNLHMQTSQQHSRMTSNGQNQLGSFVNSVHNNQPDGNSATFYRTGRNTNKEVFFKKKEDVSLVLTPNPYRNLPFYNNFENNALLYEILFRNHSILKKIHRQYLEKMRHTRSKLRYTNVFDSYIAEFEHNQSMLRESIEKKSRRSRLTKQEDDKKDVRQMVFQSMLLAGDSTPVNKPNQSVLVNNFNKTFGPGFNIEMLKINPSTVEMISAKELLEEEYICENGDYPLDLSLEQKVTNSSLNPCMKLGEFVMFLKDMRLISSNCSLVEILRTYGELRGNREFSLQIRQRVLNERLNLVKQGVDADDDEDLFGLKNDVYMEDEAQPVEIQKGKSVGIPSPETRNRVYTEANMEKDVVSQQMNNSMGEIKSEMHLQHMKSLESAQEVSLVDMGQSKSVLINDGIEQEYMSQDEIHEITRNESDLHYISQTMIENSKNFEITDIDETLFPNWKLFLMENTIQPHSKLEDPTNEFKTEDIPQRDYFNLNLPIFFNNFVELLFVTILLKSNSDGARGWNTFSTMIKEHIKIIQDHRKTPREFVVGSSGVLERLRTKKMPQKILNLLDQVITGMKKHIAKPKFGQLHGAGFTEFLQVKHVKDFLHQNGFDMTEEENLYLFTDCLECEMDPDKSYKRLYRRLENIKSRRRMVKLEKYMGKELKKKMEMHLMDFQVLEIFLVFFSKKNGFYVKDKKYNRKVYNTLTKFVSAMTFKIEKKKTRPKRAFPETQKDIDLLNIKEIKRLKNEKERERRKKKKQFIEERKEGIMMKLEDYDVQLTDSEEELEESEEFSLNESIGGESFYKYTPSAEQLYSKRYQLQKQVAGRQPSKKGKSGRNTPGGVTPKSRIRPAGVRKSVLFNK